MLVALGLAVLLVGGTFMGIGTLRQARLREASTLLVSAIRIAYDHANATSHVTRLTLDMERGTITMEETEGKLFLQKGRTGGAAAANDLEKAALEAGEDILDGPKRRRPEFTAVKRSTLDTVADLREGDAPAQGAGKSLPKDVRFRQIEVAHEDDPVTSEVVYLYFWPGGQAERAAVQLQLGSEPTDRDIMTISVKPLTGQVDVDYGAVAMRRPETDEEASEAE
ncbi:MAG: prepilin-type cleavage/methylation domain-containing protein [Deltaproteobacteria bacterium]|nr:prepilin-type cleavage/methylation domain-containing protein [Deltaproteobacteria bacterium]